LVKTINFLPGWIIRYMVLNSTIQNRCSLW